MGGTAVAVIVVVGDKVRVGGTAVTSTSGGLQAASPQIMLTKKKIFHQRSMLPPANDRFKVYYTPFPLTNPHAHKTVIPRLPFPHTPSPPRLLTPSPPHLLTPSPYLRLRRLHVEFTGHIRTLPGGWRMLCSETTPRQPSA
ncbi:MAG TPA: hypothetical protein PLD25_24550 [Chloroflexota bacterium]|nr:hypothetical protein [Chloroflexota bacterium]